MIALGIILILAQISCTVLAHSNGECEFQADECERSEIYSLSSSMLQKTTNGKPLASDSRTAGVNSGVHASSNVAPCSKGMSVGKHQDDWNTPEQRGVHSASNATSRTTSNIKDNDVLKQAMLAYIQNHTTRSILSNRPDAFLVRDVLSNLSELVRIGQNATKKLKSGAPSASKPSTLLQTVAFSVRAAVLQHDNTSRASSVLVLGLLVLGALLPVLCCAFMVLHEQEEPNRERDMTVQSEPGLASLRSLTQHSLTPKPTVRSLTQHSLTPKPSILVPKTDGTVPSPALSRSVQFPCLCSELTVPENRECALLVPTLVLRKAAHMQLTVDDVNSVPMLKATVLVQPREACFAQPLDKAQVALSTCQGGTKLAYCQLQQREFEPIETFVGVHRHTNATFGELRPDAAGYLFTVTASLVPRQVHLFFNTHSHSISFVDEAGRLLALVEKAPASTNHRFVRVGPRVDCGFVVLALFGVDMMQACASDSGVADIQNSPLPRMLSMKE